MDDMFGTNLDLDFADNSFNFVCGKESKDSDPVLSSISNPKLLTNAGQVGVVWDTSLPPSMDEDIMNVTSSSDDESEDEEEELLVSLKEDVENNEIEFTDITYSSIFDRLRAAVLSVDADDKSQRQKHRFSSKARAFCGSVLTSENQEIISLTKHAHLFLDFLIETLLECDNDKSVNFIIPWFSLLRLHLPESKKRLVDNAVMILSEMVSRDRGDHGLEYILYLLPHFLYNCEEYNNARYYALLLNRLLVPLYRLKCFYINPKYKYRQSVLDERPKLLRNLLHNVLAKCISRFPEIADSLVNRLLSFWDHFRHLKVNSAYEEVELIKAELRRTRGEPEDRVNRTKLNLMACFTKCAKQRRKLRREQRKRIDSLKENLLPQTALP